MKLTNFISLTSALMAAAAQANTLTVTTTADTGAGSLRAQMAAAASGDTINFAVTGTITLTTGEILATAKDLTISGPGATSLTITTNGTTRALRFINSSPAIQGITFNNCKGLPGDIDTGGAVAVDNFSSGGSAKITFINDCAFTNNQSGWGGALDIFNGGLVLSRCTFSGNTCTGLAFSTTGGGGALSIGPTVASSITNCTFSANSQNGAAAGQPGGGAIYNYGSGHADPPALAVTHCTFYGNIDASAAAGAIKGNDTNSYLTWAELENCLLVGNQAPVSILRNFSGASAGPLAHAYGSLGGNVTDESLSSAQFMTTALDSVGSASLASTVSPTLALNGGVTKTHMILRGSPAQRVGVASPAIADQRGALRHSLSDAGSYELIEPEIRLSLAGTPIPEGGSLDLGSTAFDTAVSKVLTVTNTQSSAFASGPLILSNPSLPAGISITGFPVAGLANGESANFTLTLESSVPGLFDAPMSFTGNDAFNPDLATTALGSPNSHSLQLAGLITDTMAHWREQTFGANAGNEEIAGDNANPAGDGIVNLLKYSLGLDPNVSYPPNTSVSADLAPSGFLTMSVTRNPATTDVQLSVEVTGNLNSWDAEGATVDVDTPTTLQAHDNTPMSAATSRFIRLKATRP